MPVEITRIISKIDRWKDAQKVQVEPLAGLINDNYLITVDGDQFVLRLSGQNTAPLGIDRQNEIEALTAAAKAGIAPELITFLPPEGHLVTRYMDGKHLSLEEYRNPVNIHRIVKRVKRLHQLPAIKATFSPFQRIENYTRQVQELGVPLPADFDAFLAKMEQVYREQAADESPWIGFCHNDLFCVNVIDDGRIWLIDWEFAGMGDIYYDLATLAYAYDSPDTLTAEQRDYMLTCYFGEVKDQHLKRLKGMQYLVMFFSGMWGLLQQGLLRQGLVKPVDGFSYIDYADETFDTMRHKFF
jgi:thiamine kinase-like enzyme